MADADSTSPDPTEARDAVPPVGQPPTVQGRMYARPGPRPTIWPTVIGVINIIFGSLGILGGIIGVAWMFLLPKFMEMMQAQMASQGGSNAEALGDMMGNAGLMQAFNLGNTLLLGPLLLAAGIGLTKKRRWSVSVTSLWAILRILMAIVGTVMALAFTGRMFDEMFAMDPNIPQQLQSVTKVLTIVGTVIGLVFALALPVFYLVWFRRRVIREETKNWL